MRRLLLAVPLLAAVAACDGDTGVTCPPTTQESSVSPTSLVARPAVEVTVVDSVTGNNLAPAARGVFVTGNVTDSLWHSGTSLVAYGPAGRYAVVVQATGYVLWAQDDVRVRADECGFETVQLTARLQRGLRD